VPRCPGNSCSQFAKRFPKVAGNTWEEKAAEAVAGCAKCQGTPPLPETCDNSDVEELVDEIEKLVEWENGGFKTDWDCYPFEYKKLFVEWRKAEKEVANKREVWHQLFIKSHFKEK
jgi:hypothetical protein